MLYYGSFFVLGYVFHFYREFLQGLTRYVRACAALTLLVFPLSLALTYREHAGVAQNVVGVHLAAVLVHGLCTWTLIALAGWWMVQYDLPAVVKFLCVTGFAVLVCFLSYHYGVQRTWISDFLNGRRFNNDWPWRAVPRTAIPLVP